MALHYVIGWNLLKIWIQFHFSFIQTRIFNCIQMYSLLLCTHCRFCLEKYFRKYISPNDDVNSLFSWQGEKCTAILKYRLTILISAENIYGCLQRSTKISIITSHLHNRQKRETSIREGGSLFSDWHNRNFFLIIFIHVSNVLYRNRLKKMSIHILLLRILHDINVQDL